MPDPPACTVALGEAMEADLVLRGSGGFPSTVTLALRVSTGDPDSPVWSDATSAPVTVGGGWALVSGAAVRRVTVTNPGAKAIDLVALEWAATGNGLPITGAKGMLHNG